MTRMRKEQRKICVCRLTDSYLPTIGGSITHISRLTQKMRPYAKQIIVTKNEKNLPSEEMLESIKIYRVKYFKLLPFAKLKALSSIPYFISSIIHLNHKYHFDIIHAHSEYTAVAGNIAGRILHIPMVLTIHGNLHKYYRLQNKLDFVARFDRFFQDSLVAISNPKTLLIVQDGSDAYAHFKHVYKRKNVFGIKHGYDLSDFKPSHNAGRAPKTKFKTKKDFVLITTSRLEKDRGLKYAILCLKELIGTGWMKNIKLLIIGDGSEKSRLMELSEKLGVSKNVFFVGAVQKEKIKEYLSLADLYLGTCLNGNINNSALECFSFGIPTILFNVAETHILNEENLVTLLVTPMDYKQMALSVIQLKKNKNLSKILQKNAKAYVRRHHSWNTRIRTELSAYKGVLP